MLLPLLSMVVVTLAYPQSISDGPTFLTHPPKSSTPLQEHIATNLTESAKDMRDSGKCQCVSYWLCEEVDRVSEPGTTLWIDSVCENNLDVCCKNPKPATPIPKVKRSCGYRGREGLHTFPSKNSRNSGETPWVVALMVGNTTVGAGALVHPQVVLTTAHVVNNDSNTLVARAGAWHTHTDRQRLKPQERSVENIKIHKDFVRANLFNDIALLRLERPLELAEHTNVICLPDQGEDFDQSQGCFVNGWEKKDSGAVTLKTVEADILESSSCNAKLKTTRLGKWFRLHQSFVCAEERQGFTCKGDAGAPLVCPGAEAYKVCGLVAWGIGCGDDVPAVYAKVSIFRQWVDDTMRGWGFGAKDWV